jgi:hypothetical protein
MRNAAKVPTARHAGVSESANDLSVTTVRGLPGRGKLPSFATLATREASKPDHPGAKPKAVAFHCAEARAPYTDPFADPSRDGSPRPQEPCHAVQIFHSR